MGLRKQTSQFLKFLYSILIRKKPRWPNRQTAEKEFRVPCQPPAPFAESSKYILRAWLKTKVPKVKILQST